MDRLKPQKIKLNDEIVQAISSKELYKVLGMETYIKINYSEWINKCIERYWLTENEDYIKITDDKNKVDYIVEIHVATHLCLFLSTFKSTRTREYLYTLIDDHIREQRKLKISKGITT